MKIADIADRLPSPEQTLEALGLQRIGASAGLGRLATAFGLGVVVGIGLGALLLPISEPWGDEEGSQERGDGEERRPSGDEVVEADHPYG